METLSFAPGTTIIQTGERIGQLLLISTGSVMGTSEKGDIFLGKGDIPGIFDFFCGYSFYTYVATDQVTCLRYPLSGESDLLALLKSSTELNELFSASICRQCCSILDDSILQTYNCNLFYKGILEYYHDYSDLCNKYGITPKQLSDVSELSPFRTDDTLPDYLSSYYETIRDLSPAVRAGLFRDHPEFTLGFIQKTSDDIHHVLEYLQLIADYQADYAYLLLNHNGIDLFDLYTSLCFQLQRRNEDTMSLNAAISKLMIQMEGQVSIDRALYQSRIADYSNQLQAITTRMENQHPSSSTEDFPSSLVDSVHTILNYCDYPEDSAKQFITNLTAYRNLKDRSSTEDTASVLRKRLTKAFYEIYTATFQYSLKDQEIPLPVRLFLLFGYVDEELAGKENTLALVEIAENLTDTSAHGIFTMYDWLMAIYNGKREPSRNEFDSDYTQYLHELRFAGKINAATEEKMKRDPASRVMFELQNMFPSVNKITCGRITTFCPLFSEHNCLHSPTETLTTPDKLQKALNYVRTIDYRAFYRDVLFALPEANITHETVQTEVLPDIILMPNIGIRGVLWQEIEGKRRTTPSRMMLSILCQEDITMLITRLTGEFRWEMCKRVQGARWNDVSEASLTSEYFDYIQFYKKNNDLSPDAKEKIKIGLQRAKNSYREMFVRDYIQWIYYESAGSPRTNKIVRKILFKYCPFSASIREKLTVNPLYKEPLEYHRVHTAQDLHRLQNVMRKVQNAGKPIPDELLEQQKFLEH